MPSDLSLAYYQANAKKFVLDTQGVDMSPLYQRFCERLPKGGHILDAGCGSGRDSKAFSAQGYRVTAFDACEALVEHAREYTGLPVALLSFSDVEEKNTYDGIWACASLLHLTETTLNDALLRLWNALKPGGHFYLSFKYGTGEREHNGRYFTDATEERLKQWFEPISDVDSTEIWITEDQRPERSERWLNALIRRKPMAANKLIIGGRDHPFLPQLSQAISQADEIDMTVAFVKSSGLRLLLSDFQEAIRRTSTDKPVRLRILTSDYLDVTDPEAL